MYAIEFETEITDKYIELKNYQNLINKHAKVIVLVEDSVQQSVLSDKVQEFQNLIAQRKNYPTVDSNIDIVKLCNEADSDIFWYQYPCILINQPGYIKAAGRWSENIIGIKKQWTMYISMLLTEYLFVLAKLKQIEIQQKNIVFFKSLALGVIDTRLVNEANKTCAQTSCYKSINDVIHLKFAENYCNKLMTFDSDFEKLKPYTSLQIEILA